MRKKQIGIKCMAISLVMACSVLNFTGCSIGDNTPIIGNITGLKSNQMFKIDELVCSKSEYMICLLDTAKQYAKDFGGSVDWKNKISDLYGFRFSGVQRRIMLPFQILKKLR